MMRKVLLVLFFAFSCFCLGSEFGSDSELGIFANKIISNFGEDSYNSYLATGKFSNPNDLLILFKLIKSDSETNWAVLLDSYLEDEDSENKKKLLDLCNNCNASVDDQISFLTVNFLRKNPESLIDTLPAINTNYLRLLVLLRFNVRVIKKAYESVRLVDTDSLHLISLLYISRLMGYEEYYQTLLNFLFNAIDSASSSETSQKIVDYFIRACPDWTRSLNPKNYLTIFPGFTSGALNPIAEMERLKYFTKEIEEHIIYISEIICSEPRTSFSSNLAGECCSSSLSSCSSCSSSSSIQPPPPLITSVSILNLSSPSTDSFSPNNFETSKFTDLKLGKCNFYELATLIKSGNLRNMIRVLKEYFANKGPICFETLLVDPLTIINYDHVSHSNILTFLISIDAPDSVLRHVVDHIKLISSIADQATIFGIACFCAIKEKKHRVLNDFKMEISQEVAKHIEFTKFLQIIVRLDGSHEFMLE